MRKQHAAGTGAHGGHAILQRIDHFKQRIALLHPLARIAQKTHHTMVRREQVFGALERQAFTALVSAPSAIRR